MKNDHSTSTPKLPLFSLPTKPPPPEDHPGMLTPPLQPPASVPFFWELAPGKPRLPISSTSTNSTRCLELPPRLFPEAKLIELSRCASHSTLLERETLPGSFEEMGFAGRRKESKGRGWGRRESKRSTRVCEGSSVISPCFSTLSSGGCEDGKVKRSGLRSGRRLLSWAGSRTHTHDWASKIFGSFKQVVQHQWMSTKLNTKGLFL